MSIEETIILTCALALIAISALFLIAILVSRIQKTTNTTRYERVKDGFQKRINSLLIVGDIAEKINQYSWKYLLDDFRSQLSGNFERQLLIDLLISNKRNLSGHSSGVLRKVYIRLQLKTCSRAKLRQWSSHNKIKGVQELAEMGCQDVLPEIQVLLKNRNPLVREESFIAMVRLGGAASFNLIRGYRGPVSLWMQVVIQKHLSTLSADKMPKFHYWFSSSNPALRKFAIEMTCHFKQLQAIPRLAIMLRDRDTRIAALACWALGEMGADQYSSAVEKLGKLYMLDDELSLSVIRALGLLGRPHDHESYLSWHMVHGSTQVRMEAIRSMHKLKIDCRNLLIDFSLDSDSEFDSIYAHTMEPLLQ